MTIYLKPSGIKMITAEMVRGLCLGPSYRECFGVSKRDLDEVENAIDNFWAPVWPVRGVAKKLKMNGTIEVADDQD